MNHQFIVVQYNLKEIDKILEYEIMIMFIIRDFSM